ncbi:uncharacterized protein B0T15DRAFT_528051 [Chaetomium strumarium]|uniref:Putative gamma-glutamylcyclotransferase n=1 Tax=Chaetomium strumarium TaxID=1170767 RepID=A0AAJ0GV57_9PEZI|nr:hypothetical protein B0T15DRAFT_528051 [Chaetomium strumarium]
MAEFDDTDRNSEHAAAATFRCVDDILDDPPLTYEQWKLREKIRMVEAINSGRLPLYDEPELPPSSTETTVPTEQPQGEDQDFEPYTFFVYGTLMDPEVLTAVAGLDGEPQLQDAWIEGFAMKMWNGIYPVLVPSDSAHALIKGKVWQATTVLQCLRLQRYETSAYEPVDCLVHIGDNTPIKGLVFQWAKEPTSSELMEGTFDLEHWQKTHKRPMW